MELFLLIALFSPLASSVICAFFSTKEKNIYLGVMASFLIFISFFSSIMLLINVYYNQIVSLQLMPWIESGHINIAFGFLVDEVSVVMMVVVGLVSTVVHVYSIGYMEHDDGFNRFFSYLSAFVFSMLVLVMSDNFLGLFIGWEGVGLCSWMLIGFWYKKQTATWAANEAFIMNRIADLGMLLGIFLIFWQTGSFKYEEVFATIEYLDIMTISIMGILLFIGAMGKSAQFPLHTWLADAMEGPTPVSALIHAATMVTAGVYLLIRANPIYEAIPQVGFFIATLGTFVAFFGASMALVNNDLKKIIAYSTLSQLGYMFVAAGIGAYWIALFHLVTHAFFKSLLFLGAGNVMHSMNNELNIKKMGGLFQSMKVTAILIIIASVALCGIYPFAGFFSKDKILEVAFMKSDILWVVLSFTAVLTAFYSMRLIMLVFFGEKKYKIFGLIPHEVHKFVLYSMFPLGVLSFVSGWFESDFESFVSKRLPKYNFFLDHTTEIILILLTLTLIIFTMIFTILMYQKDKFPRWIEDKFYYKLLLNQYYIPQIYNKFLVRPFEVICIFAWKKIDEKIIDYMVDFVAKMINFFGYEFDKMQSGNLSLMLRWMVVGIVVLLIIAFYFSFDIFS